MLEENLKKEKGETLALGPTSTLIQTMSLIGLTETWRRIGTEMKPPSNHLPMRHTRTTLLHHGTPLMRIVL